ncbi:MAG: 3-hydroxyacyl-CoA dehydrogenase NAD-binding domain-containing protein, partial [Gemmatimonadota bacterium]|nr:3-hydroxyacyl-CoA dehydrogenase NAD-binding domain-containing protein [Gemmatimonadota bacterium]
MNEDLQVLDGGMTFEVDRSHVGWLTFDQPGPLNVLSSTVLRSLDSLLAQLESRIANGQIHALIIRSAKPGSFIAGADVREFVALESAAEAREASAEGQRIFRRLERLRVETVAVIDGTCLGGATELILHCTHRMATDRSSTRIGLPEVRLGIIPGFGGTVRLPAVVGLKEAMGMILSGKPISARRAKRIGLVDRILPLHRAERELDEFIELVLSKRVPERVVRRSLAERLLEGTSIGRWILFSAAKKRALAETGGMYPAPLRAIAVLRAARGAHVDEAYRLEAEAVGDLLVSPESQSLVRVFLLSQQAKRALPADVMATAAEIRKAAVIGAGVMGGAIAQLIASHDVPVVLKDIDQGALDSGLRHAAGLLKKAASAGVYSEEEAGLKLALISGTLEYEALEDVDLVIEAVVERLAVKQQVMREVEAVVPDGAVLSTNTSSLSVAGIGGALDRPERFIGLHFFNPVHKMPLVEVIRWEDTRPAALATGLQFVLDMNKTPVVVADQPGFLVNRLLSPYLNEAGRLLSEGADVERVDGVLRSFGMPMGPLRLLDEIGFDVANHAGRELGAAFGARLEPAPLLSRLMEDGRLGKKNGRGFYLYRDGKMTGVDPDIGAAARTDAPAGSAPPDEDILARCLYLMVNEAAWSLADRVVDSADMVDLAMIMGTGFPPFRGGLLRWAD